jgi:hypothetical protein
MSFTAAEILDSLARYRVTFVSKTQLELFLERFHVRLIEPSMPSPIPDARN